MEEKSPGRQGRENGRSGEVAALLAAARAVLENQTFGNAAAAILEAFKAIVGADAGFVAVCDAQCERLEVVAHDGGSRRLDAATLTHALRNLSLRVGKWGRSQLANTLSGESPASDGAVESALLAPIVIAEQVSGLIGLADKPGGFSAADRQLAEVFAQMAAVAMSNTRTINGLVKKGHALASEVRESIAHLHEAEEQFRILVENLPDAIARFDPNMRYLYVSPSLEQTVGRPAHEIIGRTNRDLGVSSEWSERWEGALRAVFETGAAEKLELMVPTADGDRYYDCRLIPERGPEGTVVSVLAVARDVTDRWLAHEAERQARHVADALREATVALTRRLDRETVLTTLLDRLLLVVPFDHAAVMLIEDPSRISIRALYDGERVVPLTPESRPQFDPNEHPVVQKILATGAPVLIADVRERPDLQLPGGLSPEASWMGVPLFARGDVAGLFALAKREPGFFNEGHLRLAEAMSTQASVAVENAVLFEQMQASTLRMHLLSRRLVEVQESERRHIARELHDEAGQALVSLRYGLQLLERDVQAGGSATEIVNELLQRTDAVIDGLHRLAIDLRPPSLDHLGLEAALREYSGQTGAKSGFEVRFKAQGLNDERLPAVVETALYRVVQEAMTNVVRHARATMVDVLVKREGPTVLVMVEDNGVGFDPTRAPHRDRVGLLGLRERAEALGGTLRVESAPGSGTTVVVEVLAVDPHPDR
jgi:PAS domain S-box-containing protein